MEVVKEGRKQGGWAEKFRCTGDGNGGGGCGATLLVSQVDLYETTLDSVDESELCKTFCCQQCGVETDVEVPVDVYSKRPSDKKRNSKTIFPNGRHLHQTFCSEYH